MTQKSRKAPDKNPSIQQTIMFGLILGMKLKMRVRTKMTSGAPLRMRKKCRKIKITSSKRNFLHNTCIIF